MISTGRRHWPLVTAIGILWVAIAVCLTLSLRQNQGHLVYAIDDPYIHMAMAKNFAQHGVWGVTRYAFSSSSSSLLWTSLLSVVYFLFGVNEVAPFVFNVIFGTILCVLVYVLSRRYQLPPFFGFLVLLLIILFTPLTSLIFCGQEHTLHALVTILFVYLSAKILAKEKLTPLESSSLLILAPLLVMTRYEGLFVLLIACCLFLARRKPLYSLSLGSLGILPIAIYGLFSVSKGSYLLPNSVLLKGIWPDFSSLKSIIYFGHLGYRNIAGNPHILVLVLGALIVFYLQYGKHRRIWTDSVIMIVILIAAVCLHMQFVGAEWFHRYKAYLVALGIFVMSISLGDYLPERLQLKADKDSIPQCVALAFLFLLAASPFALVRMRSLTRVPQATTNIYEQQYQMGLFLRQFYQGEAVAANDIGAINYLADIRCLDLWGLASLEVARAIRGGHYNNQQIYELAKSRNVSIAIVYDFLLKADETPGASSQWFKVGQWKILDNVVCAADTVSFYAVDASEVDDLIQNLRAFSSHLPQDVVQTGAYTE